MEGKKDHEFWKYNVYNKLHLAMEQGTNMLGDEKVSKELKHRFSLFASICMAWEVLPVSMADLLESHGQAVFMSFVELSICTWEHDVLDSRQMSTAKSAR